MTIQTSDGCHELASDIQRQSATSFFFFFFFFFFFR